MCYLCLKIAEGETSLVKKKYQNLRIILHKIAQKMIEKTSMIDIAHQLFILTVFKTFLKDKKKIVNALQLPYSNARLVATNNLIKLIKRNAFDFRNFENFKNRIFIALNIKIERTTIILSKC